MIGARQFHYASHSDADLTRLAQDGDGDAFRALMHRANQRLFRVARAIVSDDAEAEDVLQETSVRGGAGNLFLAVTSHHQAVA